MYITYDVLFLCYFELPKGKKTPVFWATILNQMDEQIIALFPHLIHSKMEVINLTRYKHILQQCATDYR